MTSAAGIDSFVADYAGLRADRPGTEPGWLGRLRRDAMDRFRALGFPTTRHEEWRSTNVARIARTAFVPAPRVEAAAAADRLREPLFASAARLVFVNGHFSPDLSVYGRALPGVELEEMATLLGEAPDRLERVLGRHAEYHDEAFTALNTAFFEAGAFVRISAGTVVDDPIHLVFFASPGERPVMTHPRTLVVLEPRSRARIVESYIGLDEGTYFCNAVSEFVVGAGAVLDHYTVQQESEQAFHVGNLVIRQADQSRVTSASFALGGSLVRNHVNAVLAGEGAEAHLNGLFMLRGTQHVDNHLRVDHIRPRGSSREVYRGILDDEARGVFTGRIVVHPEAQKTDAKQTNRNLLLSERAQIDTKPQLEIRADDVKCTHGATVGQIDPDALFYLRARGIDERSARSILIRAFARESIEPVDVGALRDWLEGILASRFPETSEAGDPM